MKNYHSARESLNSKENWDKIYQAIDGHGLMPHGPDRMHN